MKPDWHVNPEITERVAKEIAQTQRRDMFAKAALARFGMDQEDMAKWDAGQRPDHARVAKFCVDAADALIAELDKVVPDGKTEDT